MKRLLFLLLLLCFVLTTWAGSKKMSTEYRTALVMAYSPANSVYEDDNVILEIYNEQLYASNKTTKTLFVDLSQCFLIHNGASYPMFHSEHQNGGKASKRGYSTSEDEFIQIAPATGGKQNPTFVCNLAGNLHGKYTTSETPTGSFSEYDERLLNIINDLATESLNADPEGKEYLGTAHRHLLEDESVSTIGASVAYAFSKKTEEWTSVTISTWVSDIYMAPYYSELPPELSKKEKQGFGVKKTEYGLIHIKADSPFEFEQDKSPVIVCDWEGNFKKGTFTLRTTKVAKKKKINGFLKAMTFGYAYLFELALEDTYYKSKIYFDGTNAEWGKMSYSNNPLVFKVER